MYYVTANDKFLSGWGKAEGKINKVVIECATESEADQVARNLRNRNDMKYVNVSTRKPYYDKRKYYVSYIPAQDNKVWTK